MNRTCCLALTLLLLAGCASGPRRGSHAPAFDAVEATGGTLSSASLQGKTVVYYFWATWCAPCVTSSPEIQDIQERYADDDNVRVVGVHYNDRGDPRAYMARLGYTWNLVPDGRVLVEAFGVKKIPQVVVVSPDGEVVFSQIGFAPGDSRAIVDVIEEYVEAAH